MAIPESSQGDFSIHNPLCYHCVAAKLFSIDSQSRNNIRISFSVYPVAYGAQIGQQGVSSEPSVAGIRSKNLQVDHLILQKEVLSSTCFLAPKIHGWVKI